MKPRPVPKLLAPRADQIVPRKRVSIAIERGLRAGTCWVAAPAGYGKTTAVADYVRRKALRHVWYRIDEGDRDIASFFHYMARSRTPARATARLPVFGTEYADQPREFARRFFRDYFASLPSGTLLVLDDLHQADTPAFRAVLAVLLHELPETLRCACLSRTRPGAELDDLVFRSRVSLVDQSILEFSDREARVLITQRLDRRARSIDASPARGWAAGLVLLAERAVADSGPAEALGAPDGGDERSAVFAVLAKHWMEGLTGEERDVLLKLSLLPEITTDLAGELTGSESARALVERLHARQLLVTTGSRARTVFRLHDLLRDFLLDRLARQVPAGDLARLRERAAALLDRAGYADQAVELALEAGAWGLARRLMLARAETLLAQGQRATLIRWAAALPPAEQDDARLCYRLGVANMADDAAAAAWLERAWALFGRQGDVNGQRLTAARAVLAKTDSWRTHEGLSTWTRRALELLDGDARARKQDEPLLVWSGMLRAVDFADDYRTDAPAVKRLRGRLLDRLGAPAPGDPATLRLIASETLMEHAGSLGDAAVFEQAVDSVVPDLRDPDVSPWALGLWLVAFGAVSGRYFAYARRGFPYPSAEAALRAAVEIGGREGLRGVEFGALYHLQLLMKLRNDFTEFAALIARLGEIADSRYTTQVAVVADCQAALHTMHGNFAEAYRACERFTAAIEAANEPPIERWPHFVTQFQVLLGDRKAASAAEFLDGVLHLFDGGVHRRTRSCILAARALDAKWRQAPEYPELLASFLSELRAANWPAILINLPSLAAELCADGLQLALEPELCRSLIARRALTPPASRPAAWPWALRVRVLGGFALERDGQPVNLGAKPPTRSLDIVRVLAIAKGHACALEDLHEWLWPDADGDQAKAACEQALHRLRKLLGSAELVVQREGQLRLAPGLVFVDLDAWESALKNALRPGPSHPDTGQAMERAFWAFTGPLLQSTAGALWSLPAGERVCSKFLDLTTRIGQGYNGRGDHQGARRFYLRALDLYPTSERCYEALIRGRLAQGDAAGALEDYRRYERVVGAALQSGPSPAMRTLIAPALAPASRARQS